MTVSELIERLQELPGDALVCVRAGTRDPNEYEPVEGMVEGNYWPKVKPEGGYAKVNLPNAVYLWSAE